MDNTTTIFTPLPYIGFVLIELIVYTGIHYYVKNYEDIIKNYEDVLNYLKKNKIEKWISLHWFNIDYRNNYNSDNNSNNNNNNGLFKCKCYQKYESIGRNRLSFSEITVLRNRSNYICNDQHNHNLFDENSKNDDDGSINITQRSKYKNSNLRKFDYYRGQSAYTDRSNDRIYLQ